MQHLMGLRENTWSNVFYKQILIVYFVRSMNELQIVSDNKSQLASKIQGIIYYIRHETSVSKLRNLASRACHRIGNKHRLFESEPLNAAFSSMSQYIASQLHFLANKNAELVRQFQHYCDSKLYKNRDMLHS